MDKLTSIQDHSDWLHNLPFMTMSQRWSLHRQRVNFGKQPLSIEMFVPCKIIDSVWVVLEEPKTYLSFDMQEYDDICKEYQEAKERCLFEGFVLDTFGYINHKESKISYDLKNNLMVEDIVQSEPILTPTAQKQIGLNN